MLRSLRSKSSKLGIWRRSISWFIDSHLLLCSYGICYKAEWTRKLSVGSFIRVLIPFMRALLSWSNYHPKGLPPIPLHWDLGFNTYMLGDTNIQPRTSVNAFLLTRSYPVTVYWLGYKNKCILEKDRYFIAFLKVNCLILINLKIIL